MEVGGGRFRSMDPASGDFVVRIMLYPSSCVSERGKKIYKISVHDLHEMAGMTYE